MFTFITGLTVLVGVVAILSNRYLVENHRALIQNNLPAAALTRQIQADSTYVASLGTAFTEVSDPSDLATLTDALLARVNALNAAVGDLMARAPTLDAVALPAFSDLLATVQAQSDAARARLEARGTVRRRLTGSAARLDELEDILTAQTDTARVQVTAMIADLYDRSGEELAPMLDNLADEDFFTYDRLVELGRSVERLQAVLLQVDKIDTPEALAASREAVTEDFANARNRIAYLPSAGARTRATALLYGLASELSPVGAYAAQARGLTASDDLDAALERMKAQTQSLVTFSDNLFNRMQAEATASQVRTERLGRWITLGFGGFLAVAVTAAGIAWAAVSRRTVRRLSDVSHHITALARGDYDRDIPETGNDEIGRMERALHVLRLRAAEAKRLRDALEDAVTQRTSEVVTEMQAHDRAREEAEAANRAKSEFLAMMGHEIRTPLNGVVGMLRLLEVETVDPDRKARAAIARESAENLLVLANDILDYAATQDRRPAPVPVHFSPRELMGQLAGYLKANAGEKGLGAEVDMAADIPPAVVGDLQKIRQIVVNLLSNAVKYTSVGRVALVLDHAIDPDTGLHVLSFAVTDTGIGIAPQDHVRVFDAYARGGGGEGIEGLGLGLSICRRLTEVLGGSLALESAPGKGSRFTFTLALPEGDAALVARQEETLAGTATGRRVLVVEDQPVNRMVARGYLERMGADVIEAGTGAEGIEAARAGGIDLVLMDLDLPDIRGDAAAAEIRNTVEAPPVIVLLTAHAIADDETMRRELGVDRILHKPLSPRALAELLDVRNSNTSETAPAGIVATLASDIADIGAEETAGIVEAFLDEAGRAQAAMQAALASSDWPSLARLAHRLKGAASNFALTEFCAHLGRVEAAARVETGAAEAAQGLDAASTKAVQALRAAARDAGLHLSESSASM